LQKSDAPWKKHLLWLLAAIIVICLLLFGGFHLINRAIFETYNPRYLWESPEVRLTEDPAKIPVMQKAPADICICISHDGFPSPEQAYAYFKDKSYLATLQFGGLSKATEDVTTAVLSVPSNELRIFYASLPNGQVELLWRLPTTSGFLHWVRVQQVTPVSTETAKIKLFRLPWTQ
jgi:hypothetical protein